MKRLKSFQQSLLTNLYKPEDRTQSAGAAGSRWFLLWLAGGVVLAVTLLASSISTYIAVSRGLIVDHMRRDLHSQAGMMEEQAQRTSVQTAGQLSSILRSTREQSNGRIAWILVRNRKGDHLSTIGTPVGVVFSTQEIRSHLKDRRPIFKTIGAATGPLLVEVLPFMLPPGPLRPAPDASSGAPGHPANTIEIAEFWGGADAALWSVRRHLIINSSAALALLVALITIGVRRRSYLAGQKLAQEIEIAGSVQRDLLPGANCELHGFKIAGNYLPVAGVSGDFYDTFTVPGERAAFVLGDVSGKGIPAALLMGVLHGAVRSSHWTESRLEHQEATRQINRLLCERAATTRFATMFWSYFDSQSQHLKFINAGHCPPLLVKGARRNPILRLSAGGPVLGLLAGAEFEQGSVRLDAGDCLVLYSDGIVEAANAEDEEFGEDRLAAVIKEHSEETAEAIRDQVLAAVHAFTGGSAPQDDQTLMVAVYLGAALQNVSRDTLANPEMAAYAA